MLYIRCKRHYDDILTFHVNNQLHRLNGPAEIEYYHDLYSTVSYYRYGYKHLANEPAFKEWEYIEIGKGIHNIDTIKYYIYGMGHKLDKPSVCWKSAHPNDISWRIDELHTKCTRILFKNTTHRNIYNYDLALDYITNELESLSNEIKSFKRGNSVKYDRVSYLRYDMSYRRYGPPNRVG